MKKIIRITENDLHRIIENSVKRILTENYPLGAEYDDNAPYNQDDSWRDEIDQQINDEIDSLDGHFTEWFMEEYCLDSEDEETQELIQKAIHNQEICKQYYNYRYEDIVNFSQFSDNDGTDYDDWKDRKNMY